MGVKEVFVIHGRNEKIRKGMFAFLRSLGLHPLEWSEIVQATKKSSPYIGEVLSKGFAMARAVVVLMTPDDEVRLRAEFRKESDSSDEIELSSQPRPNVLIEAGMAIGMFPDRTIIVEFGSLRQISDLLGRNVVRIDNSAQQRNKLVQRLRTARCRVNTTGNDWLTEGNLELDEKIEEKPVKDVSQDTMVNDTIQETSVDDYSKGMKKLASLCGITVEELENVISFSGDQIDVVAIFDGSTAKKQIIATQCILIAHEVILNQAWVRASILSKYLTAMGIPDKGGNLSTNLKKQYNLFARRGKGTKLEYRLTTGQGRASAYEIIQKLSKGTTI